MPAYQFSLGMQSTNSTIADVIPGVKRLMYVWEKMDVSEEYKELCYFLIHFMQIKFKFELESPIYQVFLS